MKIGISTFVTDDGIDTVPLARAIEERGFDSLVIAEHTNIPANRETPYPMGGELPDIYYRTLDPFVTLAAAAAVTSVRIGGLGLLRSGGRRLHGKRRIGGQNLRTSVMSHLSRRRMPGLLRRLDLRPMPPVAHLPRGPRARHASRRTIGIEPSRRGRRANRRPRREKSRGSGA